MGMATVGRRSRAWVLVPLTRTGLAAVALLVAAQFITWAATGAVSLNEMSHRQSASRQHK
jgi:hypothetical protein